MISAIHMEISLVIWTLPVVNYVYVLDIFKIHAHLNCSAILEWPAYMLCKKRQRAIALWKRSCHLFNSIPLIHSLKGNFDRSRFVLVSTGTSYWLQVGCIVCCGWYKSRIWSEIPFSKSWSDAIIITRHTPITLDIGPPTARRASRDPWRRYRASYGIEVCVTYPS